MEQVSPAGAQAYRPPASTYPPPIMPLSAGPQQQPVYPGGPIASQSYPPPPAMMSGPYGSVPSPLPPHQQQQPPLYPAESVLHVGGGGGGQQLPPPMLTQSPPQMTAVATSQAQDRDLKSARSTAEFSLREYMTLQRRRYGTSTSVATGDPALEDRIRRQGGAVVADLRALRLRVVDVAREAEAHRWRKWVLGGIIASFVPLVKRLFRRPREEKRIEGSSGTEYAFRKSKALLARIMDSVHGKSGLASVAFFVFSVLYVFSNEVSLQVAKTMSKRIKRLAGKIENGEGDIQEKDLAVLSGWRWRVLVWSE